MNRLKKELRRKGIRLANDYAYLPFYINGRSMFDRGNICIDDVVVNSETATVKQYYNVAVVTYQMNRNGSLVDV